MSQQAPAIELLLLGGVELRGLDRAQADRLLAQPKIVALLAVLALTPDGRLRRRDELVGLLWPELDQSHARTALRKALHAIRGVLGAEAIRARGDEEVGLEATRIWCDARDLVRSSEAGLALRTVELFCGELLPGFHLSGCAEFERWLDEERAELRERAAAGAWALARSLEQASQHTDAGLMARKAVRYSRDDERVLRRTITMLMRIGDRAGAVSLYDEFVTRLRREFGVDPAPETVALLSSLSTVRGDDVNAMA